MDLNLDPCTSYRNDDLTLSRASPSRHYDVHIDPVTKRHYRHLLLAVGRVASAGASILADIKLSTSTGNGVRIQIAETELDLVAFCPNDDLIDDGDLMDVADRLLDAVHCESVLIMASISQGRLTIENRFQGDHSANLYFISTGLDCPISTCRMLPVPNFITGLAAAVFTSCYSASIPAIVYVSVVENLSAVEAALAFASVLMAYFDVKQAPTRHDIIRSQVLPADCAEPLRIFM